MDVSLFDFDLPPDRIAQEPVEPRDASRLMVVDRAGGTWSHRVFRELPDLLDPGDLLVRNASKVIPARLVGRRLATGGAWEGLFLRSRDDGGWAVLASTRGRPRPGEQVEVGRGLRLALVERIGGGEWAVRPVSDPSGSVDEPAHAILARHGEIPLPPYIRKGRAGPGDRDRYQTTYARSPGSVAAPTAGLHFTDDVFRRLERRGVTWADLTLHVGPGTFRPIQTQRIEDHALHSEWAELGAETAETIRTRREAGGRIIAVGTTSARVLEQSALATGRVGPFRGETALYLRPGHEFLTIDGLLTNFHLPRSSLLVLVAAWAGLELTRAVYGEAIRERYRFYSYGDAMLIR
jgi:S-adenosylmethionine:tRNA ribosyltransferase-isomerase